MRISTHNSRYSATIFFCSLICVCLFAAAAPDLQIAQAGDIAGPISKLKSIGPKGLGHVEAIAAWREVSQADVGQLPEILAGMKGAGELGENWIRAAVETIAQRQLRGGGELPVAQLEEFLADTEQSPRARRLAYELVAGIDPAAEERLIPGLLNDPSLELRRDAIDLALSQAAEHEAAGDKQEALAAYRSAFEASRDLDQIKAAAAKLRELGETVDLPRHFGFIAGWKLIGPFDNSDGKGFGAVYPPEVEVDLAAVHEGKVGEVRWIEHESGDDYGIIDLNVIFDRPKQGNDYELTEAHKEAVAYAYAEFFAAEDRDVELRLGCINANKVWLNGELLTANEVYHSGMEVDQYVAKGQLKKGLNTILVKIAQNAQTESWAQRWQFQLRVCDDLGTAVLSRPTAE